MNSSSCYCTYYVPVYIHILYIYIYIYIAIRANYFVQLLNFREHTYCACIIHTIYSIHCIYYIYMYICIYNVYWFPHTCCTRCKIIWDSNAVRLLDFVFVLFDLGLLEISVLCQIPHQIMWVFPFDMHTMATDICVRDFINFWLLPKFFETHRMSNYMTFPIKNMLHENYLLLTFQKFTLLQLGLIFFSKIFQWCERIHVF